MSNFNLQESIEVLERTPSVFSQMLDGLSDKCTMTNEGGESWSPYDIVGHLIHGERTDWITRIESARSAENTTPFDDFDRFAQFEDSQGKSRKELLDEFKTLRKENLQTLAKMAIQEDELDKRGIHPHFGTVTMRELLSTWVAHDLGHIAQIARVMAHQHKDDVGPWKKYLRIIED